VYAKYRPVLLASTLQQQARNGQRQAGQQQRHLSTSSAFKACCLTSPLL
jgi:hypothetical protein